MTQVKEMLVTGDDIVDITGDSGFEELVIVGIGLDCRDVFLWVDELRKIADRFDFLLDIVFVQSEAVRLLEQRLTQLVERCD